MSPPSGPTTLDRRDLLKAAGATALVGGLPGCGPTADSALPAAGDETADPYASLDGWDLIRARVDTVVIVMMENRSFDHYFGARLLVEGDSRIDGLLPEMSNPHPAGDPVAVFPTDDFCLEDPPHSWNSSHDQFNEGNNDGFVREFYDRYPSVAAEAMGYWTRDALPVFYRLADHFTICDQWFCSVMSSTWPNRFYASCAQNGGVQGNSFPTDPCPAIYNRLTEEGISWASYYGNAPFLIIIPEVIPDGVHFKSYEDLFADAEAGTLPQVVLVDPIFGKADDHPPAHPVAGQVFVASVYDALARSPQWDRTLLIITYDEHGGFFDHVPPPKAADDRAEAGFDQLGFRVPTLVVGPWVKADHVSHVIRDHSSILALLEQLHGLPPLTARDAAADDLLEVFDLEAMRTGAGLQPVVLDPIMADEDELFAEECVTVRLAPGPRDRFITHQPELEAAMDRRLAGSPLDRRDQTEAIWNALLDHASRRGLLVRKGPR